MKLQTHYRHCLATTVVLLAVLTAGILANAGVNVQAYL